MATQKQEPISTRVQDIQQPATASYAGAAPMAEQHLPALPAVAGPPMLRPTNILAIQQTLGNRIAQRMLAARPHHSMSRVHSTTNQVVQRTLTVGKDETFDDSEVLLTAVLKHPEGKLPYNDHKDLLLAKFSAWIEDNEQFDDWFKLLYKIDSVVKGFGYIEMRGKKYSLLGTTHGMAGRDISGKISPGGLNEASIILEYPSLNDTPHKKYSQDVISSVDDKTQKSIALKEPENSEFVGGDGRKAFVDGEIHGISIRHKHQSKFKIQVNNLINKNDILALFNAYTLPNGDFDAAISGISALVIHENKVDQKTVLLKTRERLNTLFKQMSSIEANAIIAKTMATLERDIDSNITHYNESIDRANKLPEKYAARNKEIPEEIKKIEEQNKLITENMEKGDYSQMEELETNIQKMDMLKEEFEENEKFNVELRKAQLLQSANQNIISSLHDAICNLLLFAEVLSSQKPNVVVAFGAEHITPLSELLLELKKGDSK